MIYTMVGGDPGTNLVGIDLDIENVVPLEEIPEEAIKVREVGFGLRSSSSCLRYRST